jgi:hypothetical protein
MGRDRDGLRIAAHERSTAADIKKTKAEENGIALI